MFTSPQPKGREAMPTKKKSKYLYYKNQLTQGVTAKLFPTVHFTSAKRPRSDADEKNPDIYTIKIS